MFSEPGGHEQDGGPVQHLPGTGPLHCALLSKLRGSVTASWTPRRRSSSPPASPSWWSSSSPGQSATPAAAWLPNIIHCRTFVSVRRSKRQCSSCDHNTVNTQQSFAQRGGSGPKIQKNKYGSVVQGFRALFHVSFIVCSRIKLFLSSCVNDSRGQLCCATKKYKFYLLLFLAAIQMQLQSWMLRQQSNLGSKDKRKHFSGYSPIFLSVWKLLIWFTSIASLSAFITKIREKNQRR